MYVCPRAACSGLLRDRQHTSNARLMASLEFMSSGYTMAKTSHLMQLSFLQVYFELHLHTRCCQIFKCKLWLAMIEMFVTTDQTLTIDVVQTQHSGYYQCVATNRLGVAYATALLEVMAKNRRPQVKDTEPTELPPLQRDRRPSQGSA